MSRLGRLLSEFKMLRSLDTELLLGLALFAFQSEDYLTCRLGLFVKDRLGLSTKSHLLGIITTLALGKVRRLTGLVLGHLVDGVLFALSGTVCSTFLGDIHHCKGRSARERET